MGAPEDVFVDGATPPVLSAGDDAKGLRSALIMRKKSAVSSAAKAGNEDKGQSMGYGFIEFASASDAKEAMKRKQGSILEGHALQLQVSQRGSDRRGQASAGSGK